MRIKERIEGHLRAPRRLKKKALGKVEVSKALTRRILKHIGARFGSIRHSYYEKKEKSAVDEMLFAFEKLPVLGKEYWFMLFTERNGNRQLLVTFGRGRSGQYSVNETSVPEKSSENSIFESWFYDQRIHEFPTRAAVVSIGKNSIAASGKGLEFSFSGNYPKYALSLRNEGMDTASLALKEPDIGGRFDFIEYFKALFGFGAISMFSDFTGVLNGKSFEGRGFIQKVVLSVPIIPWSWVKVNFSSGSAITYFNLRVPRTPKKFSVSLEFYDAGTDTVHKFHEASLCKFGKNAVHWCLEASAGGAELECVLKVYAVKKFRMESRTLFHYTQYLVEIESIRFSYGRRVVSEKETGPGIGFVEDTEGVFI